MGTSRGRDKLITCSACGRRVPRGNTISYEKRIYYSTDLRSADDVRYTDTCLQHYCPKCAKKFGIYEKIRRQSEMRRRRRYNR